MINEHLSELNIQNHIPFLTFEELSSCIVETDIKDKAYKKISEIIIAAERNWRTPCDSINDFIITLENEINGPVTKSNLNLLLNQYSENTIEKTWESESISTLIKVFELTNETDLKTIFINLVEKVNHGRTK